MNKLHSLLFSSLSLATFSCSASEKAIAELTNDQVSDIVKTIQQKHRSLTLQSEYGYNQFTSNASTLKNNLSLATDTKKDNPLLNNQLRLAMANDLDFMKRLPAFTHNILNLIDNTPDKKSSALQYIEDTQTELRAISSPITFQKIEQREAMISEIYNSTKPMGDNVNIPNNELSQKIGDENIAIAEKRQQLIGYLNTLPSELATDDTAKLKNLQKFIEINQKKESTKDLQKLQLLEQINNTLKNGIRCLSIGAAAFLIYYFNLHTKLAEFISHKS